MFAFTVAAPRAVVTTRRDTAPVAAAKTFEDAPVATAGAAASVPRRRRVKRGGGASSAHVSGASSVSRTTHCNARIVCSRVLQGFAAINTPLYVCSLQRATAAKQCAIVTWRSLQGAFSSVRSRRDQSCLESSSGSESIGISPQILAE